MPRKTIGERNAPIQTNSNVVSIGEFLERKNYQGEIEYSSIDTFYTLDIDGDKIEVRFNDER